MSYFPPNKLLSADTVSTDLGAWQQSLTLAGTQNVSVLLIGSSTTKGGNATTLDKRYVDVLGGILHDRFNASSVPGGRFVRADDTGWTTTGTAPLNGEGFALGSHAMSASATLSRTEASCTGFELHFVQGPGQGTFTYQIDGGSAVTVTPNTSGAANRHDGILPITGLTLGSHTLKVNATNACIINGVYVFNGDSSNGVKLYNSGKGSTSTTDFTAAAADTLWTRATAIGSISLVFIMLGSNEYSGNINPVTFKANLATMIQKARTALGAPSIVLVNSYRRFDVTSPTYTYSMYGARMRELADESLDVTYIDVAGLFPTANDSTNDPFGFMDSDDIHMTDAGHNYMARVLAERLTPVLGSTHRWGLLGSSSSTDNAVARYDGTAGTQVQSSNVILSDDNKVGINGTPTERLHLIGSGSDNVRAMFEDPGSHSFQIGTDNNDNNFYIVDGDSAKILAVNGTDDNVGVKAGGASSFAKVGGTIFTYNTDVGNSGTSEADLYTDSIAASTLSINKAGLEARYAGEMVNSATATRQLKVYFGGSAIFDSGALSLSASSDWDMDVLIIRVSASVVRYSVKLNLTGASLSAYASVGELTGLTLGNANTLKITGQAAGVGAATNDIVAKLGTVEYKSVP